MHDTASSALTPGFGLAMIDHELPFHDSTKVVFPVAVWPTAIHHDEETHETLFKRSSDAPAFGLATTDQDDPSQIITNVSVFELV